MDEDFHLEERDCGGRLGLASIAVEASSLAVNADRPFSFRIMSSPASLSQLAKRSHCSLVQ
jgi:hypothetical protein